MAYFLILLGVLMRLVTHFHDYAPIAPLVKFLPDLPNFAPIAAIALFSGVYLNKKYALIIPVVAMIIGDIFIGFYNPMVMISVYGSFVFVGLIGIWLKSHKSAPNILAGSLFGSIIFFLVTNFAMWAKPISLYPHTMQGLLDCYIMGLPFFRNTIAGDLFYVGTFFILMEAVIWASKKILVTKKSTISA